MIRERRNKRKCVEGIQIWKLGQLGGDPRRHCKSDEHGSHLRIKTLQYN